MTDHPSSGDRAEQEPDDTTAQTEPTTQTEPTEPMAGPAPAQDPPRTSWWKSRRTGAAAAAVGLVLVGGLGGFMLGAATAGDPHDREAGFRSEHGIAGGGDVRGHERLGPGGLGGFPPGTPPRDRDDSAGGSSGEGG